MGIFSKCTKDTVTFFILAHGECNTSGRCDVAVVQMVNNDLNAALAKWVTRFSPVRNDITKTWYEVHENGEETRLTESTSEAIMKAYWKHMDSKGWHGTNQRGIMKAINDANEFFRKLGPGVGKLLNQ